MAFGGASSRSFARRPFGTRRPSGASAWSPLNFGTDLLFWFKADLFCSGALWADLGPSGFDLTQATGSKQPTLITADPDFDGHNSLSFSAAALQTMATPALDLGTLEMWFFCATSSGQRLYTQAAYSKSIYMSGPYQGYANNLAEGKLELIGASTIVDPFALPRMIGHRWNGTGPGHDVLQAGVSITDSRPLSQGPSSTPENGPLYIASYLDSGEYVTGKFAEIIGIKRVSTAPETALLNTYRAGQYPSMP